MAHCSKARSLGCVLFGRHFPIHCAVVLFNALIVVATFAQENHDGSGQLDPDEVLERVAAAAIPSDNFQISWSVISPNSSVAKPLGSQTASRALKISTYELTFIEGASYYTGTDEIFENSDDYEPMLRTEALGMFQDGRYLGTRETWRENNSSPNTFQWISDADENLPRLSRFLYLGLPLHSEEFRRSFVKKSVSESPGIDTLALRLVAQDTTIYELKVSPSKGYHVESFSRVRPDGRYLTSVEVTVEELTPGQWYPVRYQNTHYDLEGKPYPGDQGERKAINVKINESTLDVSQFNLDESKRIWHHKAATWIEPKPILDKDLLMHQDVPVENKQLSTFDVPGDIDLESVVTSPTQNNKMPLLYAVLAIVVVLASCIFYLRHWITGKKGHQS